MFIHQFLSWIYNHQDGSNILPSALIPFCAYQSNLKTLGTSIPGLNFPVCNAFRPTLLHGQLCYSLDIEKIISEEEKSNNSSR